MWQCKRKLFVISLALSTQLWPTRHGRFIFSDGFRPAKVRLCDVHVSAGLPNLVDVMLSASSPIVHTPAGNATAAAPNSAVASPSCRQPEGPRPRRRQRRSYRDDTRPFILARPVASRTKHRKRRLGVDCRFHVAALQVTTMVSGGGVHRYEAAGQCCL